MTRASAGMTVVASAGGREPPRTGDPLSYAA